MCIYIFERERERNIYVTENQSVISHMCPNWESTHNLGMCPDQRSNPQPFLGIQEDAPTEPPSHDTNIFKCLTSLSIKTKKGNLIKETPFYLSITYI